MSWLLRLFIWRFCDECNKSFESKICKNIFLEDLEKGVFANNIRWGDILKYENWYIEKQKNGIISKCLCPECVLKSFLQSGKKL